MESKAATFRRLHEGREPFVIPNPWDTGTARILASLGFKALATTSAGLAFSLGQREGTVSMQRTLAHCAEIVQATALPVSADLEHGFGDCAESAARTIREAAAVGLAGGSLEDHTGRVADPIYEFQLSVERIQAAAEAKQSLTEDFVLTARCENFLWGRKDLDDTIRRLQAYEQAGADVLYAPGLSTLADVRAVCSSVSKPVNILMTEPLAAIGMAELAQAGVKRISVGSALARLAYGAFIQAARGMNEANAFEAGAFDFTKGLIGFAEMDSFFAPADPGSR
jgi:2-methylisocitrate lyase-like PEP mutase family enzyme